VYGIMAERDVLPFLQRLGWGGDSNLVVDLGSSLHETSGNVHVDLTVRRTGLLPRIAFEFFSDPPPYKDFRRSRLMDEARMRGLIEPSVANALSDWVGELPGAPDDSGEPTRIFRWFDLKFVVDGNKPFLKAYLGARASPVIS
jgi:hypothetical protein